MGARGGLIAPDETTFGYIKDKEFAPKGKDWDKALAYWKTLYSDKDATFDKEVTFNNNPFYIRYKVKKKAPWQLCHRAQNSLS